MQEAFFKIPKDTIYDTDDLTSYKNLILSYLYFKRDFNNNITMSMSLMCQELGLSFGRSTSSGYQALSIIKLLISDGTLSLQPRLSCYTPDQITKSNIFVLTYDPPVTQTSNFTMLTLSEFNTFTSYLLSNQINLRTDKLLKIYLFIKSNINPKQANSFFVSGASVRSLAKVGSSTAQDILDTLEDADLITQTSPSIYSLKNLLTNAE